LTALRIVTGATLAILAFALESASATTATDHVTLFGMAFGLGMLAIGALLGPLRTTAGAAAWAVRALFGFAMFVAAYGVVGMLAAG
jgi:hypothetical protein